MMLLDTNVLSEYMRPAPAPPVVAWLDAQAATHYAAIVAQRTRAGRPITVEDAQIAAIALSHRSTLVTRNTRDFVGIEGLALFDPWQSAA
jgi:predicted nucleic acid-binding protein